MGLKLKTYEDQARFAVVLAAVGGFFALGALAAVIEGFNWRDFLLTYRAGGARQWVILGCLFLGLAGSVTGFCVAYNSAGQRRNKKSRLSWIAFFVNAAIITLTLSTGAFFWFTKNPMQPPS